MNDIMTVEETAEFFRISKKSVYKLIENNEIPARKIGRVYRLRRENVVEFMTKGETESGAA